MCSKKCYTSEENTIYFGAYPLFYISLFVLVVFIIFPVCVNCLFIHINCVFNCFSI